MPSVFQIRKNYKVLRRGRVKWFLRKKIKNIFTFFEISLDSNTVSYFTV